MSMTSCRKVLGEINNILDSRSSILNKKETKEYDDNTKYVSSPIQDYQMLTMGNKLFPDTFDKTLTPTKIFNNIDKKVDSFNYDGFIDEDNDPFNSNVSHFDLFDKSIIDDQVPTKFSNILSENISVEENNKYFDDDLSNIIDNGCESSFMDFKPYEFYMNAFYNKDDVDYSNSRDSEQIKNDRNTILTKDVIDTLSSTTSSSTSFFTDSSLGIKKANLDIRFTEDNQIKAEHIANMTPGTFFGLRSAPLGCLDGESLTPSKRVNFLIYNHYY